MTAPRSRPEYETVELRQKLNPLLLELIGAHRLRHDLRLEPLLQSMGLLTVRKVWGLSWVVPEEGTYRPAVDGEIGRSAIIVPAFEGGELVDLIAEGLASRRLLPRTGAATMIGHDAVECAKALREPLFVFDRPSGWLRGHCLGVVVLNWNIGFELEGVRRIACTVSIADRLYTATRRYWPRPIIIIPRTAENHFADSA